MGAALNVITLNVLTKNIEGYNVLLKDINDACGVTRCRLLPEGSRVLRTRELRADAGVAGRRRRGPGAGSGAHPLHRFHAPRR